jgi:glyoxylase-like metal-dependent hydrolase (beta-lactamase superfamily II)
MVALPAPSRVEVEQLTDWLYCLRTPVVQAYAIQQSTGFVFVDAGVVGHEHAFLEALAGAAGIGPGDVRVTEILITHGHPDHSGSAAALAKLTGAKVRGSALDAEVIEGRASALDPQLLEWEVPLLASIEQPPPAPPVKLDELVDDTSRLGWERAAQIVAVPGHTVGSIAVFFPEDHVLVAGDAIASTEGEPILGVFNVDPEQARASFRRLAQLDASLVCFGHGDAITADAQSRLARVADSF